MIMELVRSYLRDSLQAYTDCASALGVFSSTCDLHALTLAARKGDVKRLGAVTTPAGVRYEYHIHGAGYSFTSVADGRHTSFDVCSMDHRQCLRFSVPCLTLYAESIGQHVTREAVDQGLRAADLSEARVVHVVDDPFSTFCYPIPRDPEAGNGCSGLRNTTDARNP